VRLRRASVADGRQPWQSNSLRAYSQRLSWNFPTNSLSRLIAEKKARGVRLLDLTISNPTEAFADYPHAAIRRAYADIANFTYQPNPCGELEARRAIAEWYAQQGITISAEQLLLTASSSEAYALLFKLFCNPEDEILAPVPSYPLFEFLASLESVRIVPYRLLYDGAWFIDFTSLAERISPRARAIVIVSPNNPTGSFLKQSERDRIFAIAQEHELPIICDEVFMSYAFGSAAERVQTLIGCDSVLSFSLNGLSKAAAMPQVKLGWIAINGPLPERDRAHQQLQILLDTYLSVSTPVQRALPALLHTGADLQRQICARIQRNRNALGQLLEGSAAHCLHVEGGWSAIVQLPNTSTEEAWVAQLLEQHEVVVQPGYFFDMGSEPYIVLSLLTAPDVFDEGIRRLAALVCDCSKC